MLCIFYHSFKKKQYLLPAHCFILSGWHRAGEQKVTVRGKGVSKKGKPTLDSPGLSLPTFRENGGRGWPGSPSPQRTLEANTYLGLLLPEREPLLLVQQPRHDQEAELASKLPVGEGARETEGCTLRGAWGFRSGDGQGSAGHTWQGEQGRAPVWGISAFSFGFQHL